MLFNTFYDKGDHIGAITGSIDLKDTHAAAMIANDIFQSQEAVKLVETIYANGGYAAIVYKQRLDNTNRRKLVPIYSIRTDEDLVIDVITDSNQSIP